MRITPISKVYKETRKDDIQYDAFSDNDENDYEAIDDEIDSSDDDYDNDKTNNSTTITIEKNKICKLCEDFNCNPNLKTLNAIRSNQEKDVYGSFGYYGG